MKKIQRALISVFNKTGLLPFASILSEAGVEIISTGGTAKILRENGLPVIELSEYTGFPEMLDGRVKTLHPRVHGGLLYVRGDEKHEATIQKHDIRPIDLVVVNLYPFEQTIARPGVTLAQAIENIDIGGPSMLRSAAKNHESVTVIVDPLDYEQVAEQIQKQGGTTLELRQELAAKVYARTSEYDRAIANYLNRQYTKCEKPCLPERFVLSEAISQPLRYGENPHQKAALYGHFDDYYKQLHGKELSYNNILDLTAATFLISEFYQEPPTLAILKHTNPCGLGQGASLKEAWDKAYATDKQAPFGGIIAVNKPMDTECASEIAGIYSEVIVAPDFTPEAIEILTRKKNLRLLKVLQCPLKANPLDVRSVGADSYLVQERDLKECGREMMKVVTKRQPTEEEWAAMLFGWRVVKHVKSNAIIYTGPNRTLGIGAGQMSRVDSSRIAVWKAEQAGLCLKGSVICSDAFFPFADGLIAAADAGATAAIQPGGSVRDEEVIAAANERGLAMVFTSMRHFRH
ncbi:MAG: bifunctional phosphoribosylaminoimidazolecarboxamide formyltransferase/IMP cyclohydrolase [Limisphaerales bacterium]|jgi:phosphoribosylaminoimidazolecarboxamide formyltransferase/IMP cyclohydrolase|nr:bifunctional phosphoribosylaminoimidazolecarboxamide formyltransferase/IMP cyclohydrolase [Verrucomicrobiota bacterium]